MLPETIEMFSIEFVLQLDEPQEKNQDNSKSGHFPGHALSSSTRDSWVSLNNYMPS